MPDNITKQEQKQLKPLLKLWRRHDNIFVNFITLGILGITILCFVDDMLQPFFPELIAPATFIFLLSIVALGAFTSVLLKREAFINRLSKNQIELLETTTSEMPPEN